MQGLVIAQSSDPDWDSSIERHFDMNLAPFLTRYGPIRISLERRLPSGYVCELRGERRGGEKLQVKVMHDDGEMAIALACGRARREIRRAARLMRR